MPHSRPLHLYTSISILMQAVQGSPILGLDLWASRLAFGEPQMFCNLFNFKSTPLQAQAVYPLAVGTLSLGTHEEVGPKKPV